MNNLKNKNSIYLFQGKGTYKRKSAFLIKNTSTYLIPDLFNLSLTKRSITYKLAVSYPLYS